jgi:hypothetical protein
MWLARGPVNAGRSPRVASRVQAGRVIPPLEPGTRRPPVDPTAPRESRSRRAPPASSPVADRPRQSPGRPMPAPRAPPGLGLPKSPPGAGPFFGLATSDFPGNRHLLRQRGCRRMRALSPSTDIGDLPGRRRLERPLPRRFRTLKSAALRPRTGGIRPRRAAPIARRAARGPACGIRESVSFPEPMWLGGRAAPSLVVFGEANGRYNVARDPLGHALDVDLLALSTRSCISTAACCSPRPTPSGSLAADPLTPGRARHSTLPMLRLRNESGRPLGRARDPCSYRS